jgi:hypothetical protein
MGNSTDAMLFYGFQIPGGEGEDELAGPPFWATDEGEAEEDDWEDFVAAKMGIVKPAVEYSDAASKQYEAFWKAKARMFKTLGVSVQMHCSYDAAMYALKVDASYLCANRGYPIEIEDNTLVADPKWDRLLDHFCAVIGIKRKPSKWILASMWG